MPQTFDYVRCEMPLPDGWKSPLLHSRDLTAMGATHRLLEDGQLLLGAAGPFHLRRREVCSHVRLYGSEIVGHEDAPGFLPPGRPIYKWHEYKAIINDGRVTDIFAIR